MYHEMHRYPHTNLNEANLDYICSKVGDVENAVEKANETVALAETVKDEAEAIKDEVTATGETVTEQYEIVLEKANEISDSAAQITTNKNNISTLNTNLNALDARVDDIEDSAELIHDDGGHILRDVVSFNPSATHIESASSTHVINRFRPLGLTFAKIFAITTHILSAGSVYPVGYVPQSLSPSYKQPLSITTSTKKEAEVYIETDGSIVIYCREDLSADTSLYITGFWHNT